MTTSNRGGKPPRLESGLTKWLILGSIGIAILGLILLGNWQLKRLDWKLALIERVEARAFAAPVAAPLATAWSNISRLSDEYRRVVIHGRFLHQRETLVGALTERGNGYWVVTPLLTTAGETVLINRGYIPVDAVNPEQRKTGLIDGAVSVTGLLRISEPDGIPLRDNDPKAERWYSRDVAAIASARKLTNTAPYFIDADDTANPGGLPIGGLTRLSYRNVHLFYALTWYGLALLLTAMTLRVIWLERSGRTRDD